MLNDSQKQPTPRAQTLVTVWRYLKQAGEKDPDLPIWDDLDSVIELCLRDADDAPRLVNEVLDRAYVNIGDLDDAEEVAMRIIRERDLRFPVTGRKPAK